MALMHKVSLKKCYTKIQDGLFLGDASVPPIYSEILIDLHYIRI